MGKIQPSSPNGENHLENTTESSVLSKDKLCMNGSNGSASETVLLNAHLSNNSRINETSGANGYDYPMLANENGLSYTNTDCYVPKGCRVNGILNVPSGNSCMVPGHNSSDEPNDGVTVVCSDSKKINDSKTLPGKNIETKKRNNGSTKDASRNVSPPADVSQKSNSFTANGIDLQRTYSSVVANGLNGTSQLNNTGCNSFSDAVKLNAFHNDNASRASVSDAKTSDNISKNFPLDDKVGDSEQQSSTPANNEIDVLSRNSTPSNQDDASCKQTLRNIEKSDFSVQTEDSSSLSECPSSTEEASPKLENACTAINGVDVQETEHLCNAAACLNVISDDSGRGDTDVYYNECRPYCCLIRREVTPILIGKKGATKREIENISGIKFWIHPHDHSDLSIVEITGTGAQIEMAKQYIKDRFRNITLNQWLGPNPEKPALSENYYPTLPEGTDFMGVVSCICDPHFFWLQQYGHPQFHALEDLERRMTNHFNSVTDAPGVENPAIDSVVAVPGARDGENVKWIRGAIINTFPDRAEVVVRYLDHGGDHLVPVNNIRPMRHEFFTIPFFAAQCCLHDILPTGEIWSDEARAEFTRLCNGFYPPIIRVIYRTPVFYYVAMSAYDSETQMQVDVAVHLITKGLGYRPPLPATDFSNGLQH